jgi:lysophospholipase L1-like esterase
MPHVALLGDSIFDNGSYVPGEPDVVRQLRARLPAEWAATLLAVDGAVTESVVGQLRRLPANATHLVVSVGGNDALGHIRVLEERASSVAEALTRLAEIAQAFGQAYQAMLDAVSGRGLPIALCTIYDPSFADPTLRRLAFWALAFFNDVILRQAIARGLPILDLRLVCDREEDFANPIEPSAKGGEKIAACIVRLLAEHDFTRGRTEAFVR